MFIHRNAPVAAPPKVSRRFTTDSMMTFDRATIDSTGTFLFGQLERFDSRIHEPLVKYTWSRDVDTRDDVTFADDAASFTVSSFAAPGGIVPTGKNWIASQSNAIPGPSLDIGRVIQPIHPWGMELSWSVRELEKAQKLGQPIDQQKLSVLQLKHQMDCDEMVYVGDAGLSAFGLLNSPRVPTLLSASGGTTWAAKIAAAGTNPQTAILGDVNSLLSAVYTASALTRTPTRLLLPPAQFGLLASTIISSAGVSNVLGFLRDFSLSREVNNRPLEIYPLKWLTGAGSGGTDRMVAYTMDPETLRFPVVPLAKTPVEYRSLWQSVTYYGALGQLEIIYPETLGFMDGV